MKGVFYDVVVVGAGVVGCAIAREISIRYPDKRVIVLEKLSDVGLETSRFNSGVLHSGFHQDPRSLKSRLAREGSRLAVDYMADKGLAVLRCGMLIALSGESFGGALAEIPSLVNMARRGLSGDLKVKFMTSSGVRKLEPNLKSWGGIFIPEVRVIDPVQFVGALYRDACQNGVDFYFNFGVEKIIISDELYFVRSDLGEVQGEVLINAAGLYADDVSAMVSIGGYKLYPWRGEYYEVVGAKMELIKRLVYPVNPPHYPGKGIHFSPRVDGRLFVGPNARLVPSKNYYTEDKTDVSIFVEHIGHFCPDIRSCDLKWAYSGIRPTLSDVSTESDFIIKVDRASPKLINLIGIDSPGLSASMAIAKYVCGLV